MAKIKEKDFIELDFTGKLKETGEIFDTTSEKVAKENNLDPKAEYKPVIVCIGKGTIFEKLEKELIGKELGKEYTISLKPEEAFGKKNAKLIQLMPTSIFKKENIKPKVGLYVNVNDRIGIIRTVNGGRCLVDFNHPLSGKELVYKIKPLKKITDKKKQVEQIIKTQLRVNDFKLKEKEGKITIVFDEKISKLLNEKMRKVLVKDIKEMTGQTVKIK